MRVVTLFFSLMLYAGLSLANLKYHPVSFILSTDKESYYEGEKIAILITITNNDKERTLPVLLPHTQNTGQKLFYLNAYDKADNTLLLRYTEDRMLNMMVHDTGTVAIKYLKPLEQVVVRIYLNDFENYYNYHTQNTSHHSFGVPLFAGVYKINATYNPNGIALGDSIYTYYNDFEKNSISTGKQLMPQSGQITQMIDLKIKRSTDSVVTIEGNKYFIKTDGDRFFYLSKNLPRITTDTHCHHITNLPPDSYFVKNEYFYSHFNNLYAEYIARFEDGDIREYRKFSDWCPSYLYTERYNDFKQKTHYELQLPDKRFYSVSYHQPGGSIHQETFCSADGTLCNVTTYEYNKEGKLKGKKSTITQPCVEVELEGSKKSVQRVVNLGG